MQVGRDFAAWLGLTPRQNSSGGTAKLGAVTKPGNRYIRKLFVVGSTAVLRCAGKRRGRLADLIAALRARKPGARPVVLAHKLARIRLGDHDDRREVRRHRTTCRHKPSKPIGQLLSEFGMLDET